MPLESLFSFSVWKLSIRVSGGIWEKNLGSGREEGRGWHSWHAGYEAES